MLTWNGAVQRWTLFGTLHLKVGQHFVHVMCLLPRGSKYPIFEVSGSENIYPQWIFEPETSNTGYLDPLGYTSAQTTTEPRTRYLWSQGPTLISATALNQSEYMYHPTSPSDGLEHCKTLVNKPLKLGLRSRTSLHRCPHQLWLFAAASLVRTRPWS